VHSALQSLHCRYSRTPKLDGKTLEETWRSVLRRPDRYRLMSPTEIIPDAVDTRWQSWREWLRERYRT
jgi:hypothetical protein